MKITIAKQPKITQLTQLFIISMLTNHSQCLLLFILIKLSYKERDINGKQTNCET